MLEWVLAVAWCLSVCLSQVGSSVEMAERIELVFGMVTSAWDLENVVIHRSVSECVINLAGQRWTLRAR